MFSDYSDAEIWAALELVGLKDMLASQPQQIDTDISSGGESISVGQRQLLCLARALLAKPKVLVMDEATSSFDNETEKLIQDLLLSKFSDCTVISIAHRLNTIALFDKVIVMDQGSVLECASPEHLLSIPDSAFSQLVKASGSANQALVWDAVFKGEKPNICYE